MKGFLAIVTVALGLAAVSSPAHAVTIVLPRAGQVGVGLQGQFGGFSKSGSVGRGIRRYRQALNRQ